MLLASVGVDPEEKIPYPSSGKYANWKAYGFKNDNAATSIPVLLIEKGPKTVGDAKRFFSGDGCILIFRTSMKKSGKSYKLFLKSVKESTIYALENEAAYDHASKIFQSHEFDKANSKFSMLSRIKKIIQDIHEDTGVFINRGIFSNHYLNNRLFKDLKGRDIKTEVDIVIDKINGTVWEILDSLNWKNTKSNDGSIRTYDGVASILVVKPDTDLDMMQKENTVSPSYMAVAELENSDWVILTNGKLWRLYTRKAVAPSTSYFQIDIKRNDQDVLEYFVAIFSALTYQSIDGKQAHIDYIFEESKDHAEGLGKDLTERIITRDGVLLSLVKGLLDYDSKKKFSPDKLNCAKETALKVMYRVWFLIYAESLDLLPVKGTYRSISLEYLRTKLDSIEIGHPNGYECWEYLLNLFDKMRNGDSKNNLPQYNGELFATDQNIESTNIKNKFIVKALRGLFEKDGQYVDYAELDVRRIGDVYEQLLELDVVQTDRKIAVLKNGAVVDISKRLTQKQSKTAYFYEKNELYLSLKGGIVSRKISGSYYTPDEIVKFLVRRGLEHIFKEREDLIEYDLEQYKKNPSSKNRAKCENRLLDIQVLDPAMGSGHFLIEALNQITRWATRMLEKYPEHPVLQDIKSDREVVIGELKNKGINIDEAWLTPSSILKRKILKRCIFGVDLNRLAVELARLSLWLDSFVVGMPLTYMNHHIKWGDSTIGMWKEDLMDPENQSLDNWIYTSEKKSSTIDSISHSPDITIKQVRKSKKMHQEYEDSMNAYKTVLNVLAASKMDGSIIPRPPPGQSKELRRMLQGIYVELQIYRLVK